MFDQPDAAQVHARVQRVIAGLEAKFAHVAEHLAAAAGDLLAFTAFPREVWGARSGPTTPKTTGSITAWTG